MKVTVKPFGTISYLGVHNQKFMGKRAWSEEVEKGVSGPIEDAFLKEVSRVEAGENVENHGAISGYHLLWVLRYYYALNPLDETEVFKVATKKSLTASAEEVQKYNQISTDQALHFTIG